MEQLGEHHADTASRLEPCGSQCADTQHAVPADQVGELWHILAGHHEAYPGSCSYQGQSLTEPVETDFTFPRFEAEGRSLSWEEEDAFSHTQAVLQETEERNAVSVFFSE